MQPSCLPFQRQLFSSEIGRTKTQLPRRYGVYRREQYRAVRSGQLSKPLDLSVSRSGTHGERRASELTPCGNRCEDRKDSAPAIARAVAGRPRVGELDLTEYSRSGLDCINGEKIGGNGREGTAYSHYSARTGLTSLHREGDVRPGPKYGL